MQAALPGRGHPSPANEEQVRLRLVPRKSGTIRSNQTPKSSRSRAGFPPLTTSGGRTSTVLASETMPFAIASVFSVHRGRSPSMPGVRSNRASMSPQRASSLRHSLSACLGSRRYWPLASSVILSLTGASSRGGLPFPPYAF